jgi:hypothetical protein
MDNREPVLTAVSVGAIVAALLQLLIVFGLEISDEQVAAVLAFVAVVAPVVLSAIYARSKVSPVEPPHDHRRRA